MPLATKIVVGALFYPRDDLSGENAEVRDGGDRESQVADAVGGE